MIFNVQGYVVGAQEWLILASGMALVIATCVKIRSILKGSTSAAVVTWLIWTVVNAVSLAAQCSAGSTLWELAVPTCQLGSTAVLLVTSAVAVLCEGNWRRERIDRGDAIALTICVLGVAAGWYFSDPFITLWGNFAANLAGLAPIFRQGRARPNSVTRWYWVLRGVSTIAATAAFLVEGIRPAGLIPSTVGIIIVVVMLWAGRRPKKRATPQKTPSVDQEPVLV